jgi:hypothetical protein
MRALSLLLLLAMPAVADCIANGHYTIVGNYDPMIGTAFPYTEDLASARNQTPVAAPLVVQHYDDLRWTKVQTGCASFAEQNVSASTPVNLMLRASFRINEHNAPNDARYQIQLRLGNSADDPDPRIVATETRRLGVVPRSDRFGAIVPHLPAGSYVYSLLYRILDGSDATRATLDLQWITAQGAPAGFPAERESIPPQFWIDGNWQPLGHPLHFESDERIDVVLQSSITVEEADDDATLDIAFTIDNAKIGDDFGTVAVPASRPDSLAVFDARSFVRPAEHTLRFWLRAPRGHARVSSLRFELMGFPSRLREHDVIPMLRVSATDVVIAKSPGSSEQPHIPAGCGPYTKLLDFTMPPSSGEFSWHIEGYAEIQDVELNGYGRIAIVNEHHDPNDESAIDAVTDMGILEFQAQAGGDGIYFYGDASKWGNVKPGDRMSLWISRIEGCRGVPLGGGFRVGKRWLAVKMLPSSGPHLP